MGRSHSCGEMVSMAIFVVNDYGLISLIGLHARREDHEIMDRAKSCGKTVLMPIFGVNENNFIYFL